MTKHPAIPSTFSHHSPHNCPPSSHTHRKPLWGFSQKLKGQTRSTQLLLCSSAEEPQGLPNTKPRTTIYSPSFLPTPPVPPAAGSPSTRCLSDAPPTPGSALCWLCGPYQASIQFLSSYCEYNQWPWQWWAGMEVGSEGSGCSWFGLLCPGGAVVTNPPANAGDPRDEGLIPGSRRFLGGGNGNLLQYSFLENSTDRGAWQATVCACCVLSCFSRVQLFVTLWTVTRLALPSMGILQVRILTFSRGSSRPRDWTHASALASAGGFFTLAPWEAPGYSPEGFKEWIQLSACACICTNTHTHTLHQPSSDTPNESQSQQC